VVHDRLAMDDATLGDDSAAELRDGTADLRDGTADGRDGSADERDRIADERDRIADDRDLVAEQFEGMIQAGMSADALNWSAMARSEARNDRRQASEDRRAGATGRRQAERDRDAAMADRVASASERLSASVDGLTGVYRRDRGFAELQREVARAHRGAEPLVVAFVDVDHLKVINDSYGHAAGDSMLRAVAEALRTELRSYDLIFRYGGDELVCALPGIGLTDAKRRFARVNEALSARPEGGSVTVGVTDLKRGDTAHGLVARADAAFYRARQHRPAV
jgi:diguanylate cyclase (GGDEF)-like protein